MEDFMLFSPTAGELKLLNQCRLFLQVLSLSDICNSKGNAISRNCWEGKQRQPSPRLWPCQHQPSMKAWRTWRTFVSKSYLVEESARRGHSNLSLSYPLGPWTLHHYDLQMRSYYINPTLQTIYKRHKPHCIDSIYNKWSLYRTTQTQLTYTTTGWTGYLPETAVPIDCQSHGQYLTINKSHLPQKFPRIDPRFLLQPSSLMSNL